MRAAVFSVKVSVAPVGVLTVMRPDFNSVTTPSTDLFMAGFHMRDLFGVRRVRLGSQRGHQDDGGYDEERKVSKISYEAWYLPLCSIGPLDRPCYWNLQWGECIKGNRLRNVRGCPLLRTSDERFSNAPSKLARYSLQVGGLDWSSNCARRARPFRGRAFREQKGPTRLPTTSTLPRSSLPQTLPSFRRIPPALFPNTRLFESVCTDAEGRDG